MKEKKTKKKTYECLFRHHSPIPLPFTSVKKLTLVFGILKFRQLSNNEQEVDDGEVRQALCGDVDLRKDR